MYESKKLMKIVGISALYHDSAAALLIGYKIVAAAQEERFTHKAHSSDFPVNAIKYCLEYSECNIDELPGRAVCYLPAPPQIRTSGFFASGSSVISFAKCRHKNDIYRV